MSAPLRIVRPAVSKTANAPADNFKDYLGRLVKLVPAEAVSLYLVGNGLIPADQKIAFPVWAAVGFVAVIVSRITTTSDVAENVPPQWKSVIISCVAYVIWLYSIGGPFTVYNVQHSYIGSLAVLVFTFFVPFFYKGT